MIYAIGDSFTYGDELPSQDLAWPALLAKRLNKQIINKGRPATGNNRMVKRALDAIIEKSEMVIIGWSDCNRVEFGDEIGIYDIWAGRNWRLAQSNDHTHRIQLIKYLTAYDFPQYYYANWLRQIILIQNMCKFHNIPCVMFIACGSHEHHKHFSNQFDNLVNFIDHSMFVTDMFTSVNEWVYNAPAGPAKLGPNGHPLEQGHEIIADKIYEHIRNKCWIS